MQCALFSHQKLCFKNTFWILYLSSKVKTNMKERHSIDYKETLNKKII